MVKDAFEVLHKNRNSKPRQKTHKRKRDPGNNSTKTKLYKLDEWKCMEPEKQQRDFFFRGRNIGIAQVRNNLKIIYQHIWLHITTQ